MFLVYEKETQYHWYIAFSAQAARTVSRAMGLRHITPAVEHTSPDTVTQLLNVYGQYSHMVPLSRAYEIASRVSQYSHYSCAPCMAEDMHAANDTPRKSEEYGKYRYRLLCQQKAFPSEYTRFCAMLTACTVSGRLNRDILELPELKGEQGAWLQAQLRRNPDVHIQRRKKALCIYIYGLPWYIKASLGYYYVQHKGDFDACRQ